MIIDLAWPHKNLNPNQRVHWAEKSRLAKSARIASHWAAKAAGADKLQAEALNVTVTFLPPDSRRRDTDNMVASIKHHLDGIADAAGVNDSKFNLTIRRGEAVMNGCVRVELEPARAT